MSDIKQAFPSRFPNGVLMESDFSQLEVVGLAALSRDPVLIQDLLDGRDMHRYYTAKRLKIKEDDVTPKERGRTKKMTFQLQYGSGAKNMARKLGMTQAQCQAFIDAYYSRYVRVAEWQKEVYESVVASRQPSARRTTSGAPAGRGEYHSVTGRIYSFYESDPPWSDGTPTFTPTQTKNFPVQGFATGDVMPVFRQKWLRWWVWEQNKHLILPINTVHDSGMTDCASMELAVYVAKNMDEIVKKLPEDIFELWGVECPVPFKIEHKAGPTWATMEKING